MTDDEIRRTMEFILERQAIFSSGMIELKSRLDQMALRDQEQREAAERQAEITRLHGERIDRLAAAVERQAEVVFRQSEDIRKLAIVSQQQGDGMKSLGAFVRHVAENMEIGYKKLSESAEVNRQEMRLAMEKLNSGNEATRELANRAAQLAIQVSQRQTAHERDQHTA